MSVITPSPFREQHPLIFNILQYTAKTKAFLPMSLEPMKVWRVSSTDKRQILSLECPFLPTVGILAKNWISCVIMT